MRQSYKYKNKKNKCSFHSIAKPQSKEPISVLPSSASNPHRLSWLS